MKYFMEVLVNWFATAEDLKAEGTKKADKIVMKGCSFGF